jgi:GrpB-like predicted nucleotidyltransferase (UPF0157 family)
LSDGIEYVRPQPRLQGRIELAEYDERWPLLYAREEQRLRRLLGGRVVRVEHAGSTSVPGLAAKPIVDIVLEVPDTRDEGAYVEPLETAGYTLTIREASWYEHRLFKGPDTNINLHVFSRGCSEVDRMLIFRDWLRSYTADRDRYLQAKRELAAHAWEYVQDYADAKSEVVREIMQRALVGAAAHENAEWCELPERGDGFWFSRVRTRPYYPDAVTLVPGVDVNGILAVIDTSPGASIKDSFDDLDPPGFAQLFRAHWLVWRRETLPEPHGEPNAIAHPSGHVVGLGNLRPGADWAEAAADACAQTGRGTVVGYERTVPPGAEEVGSLSVWINSASSASGSRQ